MRQRARAFLASRGREPTPVATTGPLLTKFAALQEDYKKRTPPRLLPNNLRTLMMKCDMSDINFICF